MEGRHEKHPMDSRIQGETGWHGRGVEKAETYQPYEQSDISKAGEGSRE
jgi:hypothetical protein